MSSENLKISSTIHEIQSMRIFKKGLGCGASHHFKYSFCKYFFLFTFSIHFIKEKLLFGVSSLLFNVQCTVFPLSCYSYVDIFPSQLYFLFLKNEKKKYLFVKVQVIVQRFQVNLMGGRGGCGHGAEGQPFIRMRAGSLFVLGRSFLPLDTPNSLSLLPLNRPLE